MSLLYLERVYVFYMRCEYWPILGLHFALKASVCSLLEQTISNDDARCSPMLVDSMVVNCNWIRVGKESHGADLAVVAVIAFILVHVLLFIVYGSYNDATILRYKMNKEKSTKTLYPTSSVVATKVPPATMQRRRQTYFIVTTLVALFTLSIIISWAGLFHMPPVIDATANNTSTFSEQRARVHLNQIAQRPHPFGSQDNERVANYIISYATSLQEMYGSEVVEVQTQNVTTTDEYNSYYDDDRNVDNPPYGQPQIVNIAILVKGATQDNNNSSSSSLNEETNNNINSSAI